LDNKLKKLFSYQRFAGNKDLQKVIDDTNASMDMLSLDDDDLTMASAGMGSVSVTKKCPFCRQKSSVIVENGGSYMCGFCGKQVDK